MMMFLFNRFFWSAAFIQQVLVSCANARTSSSSAETPVKYGVDISYPMHSEKASTNYAWLSHNVDPDNNDVPDEYKDMPVQHLGDMQKKFEDFIDGCVKHYGSKGRRCIRNEQDRIEMSIRQPQSMRNYTKLGYTKIKAPDNVFKLLKEFWDTNKDDGTEEAWGLGNIYTNHWEAPTFMVSVEDEELVGGGFVLKQQIWNAARDTIQEWTGQELAECSLYGIRVYKEGAVLATHVDRLPLVSSAIINVDQDVDEPWPLEVIGHDGVAVNVTMEPGDLVLYESHSILHGRPFPLKGRFMANVFIHFEPIGAIGGPVEVVEGDIPPYLIRGSPEEDNWWAQHPGGHKVMMSRQFTTGSTEAHHYADEGNIKQLKKVLDRHADLVNARDSNGWTPLHEAVRAGYEDVVLLLLDRGADVNARTGEDGEGGSPLYLAMELHSDHEDLHELLKNRKGEYIEPDL